MGWQGFRNFRVARRHAESSTIVSFYLEPEDGGELPEFEPGQFLTFRLHIEGEAVPIIRTYTLSEAPGRSYYRVSIKKEARGLASRHFHERVKKGSQLEVMMPSGLFHLDRQSDVPVALISGGVGITPMLAMLDFIVERQPQRQVWFLHSARNGAEHAFGKIVRNLAAQHANVHAHICYSRPLPEDEPNRDFDTAGRIDIPLIASLLPNNDFEFYLCGPTGFMKAIYNGLLDWDVPEVRIHYENFGPATVLKEGPPPAGKKEVPAGSVEVTFARSGKNVRWNPEAGSLLEFAESQGLSPAFGCRSGMCHTCKCTLIEGEVIYEGAAPALPEDSDILICCSKPKGSVTLDL